MTKRPADPVDRIVHNLENATISQLQRAFHRLGWPLRFVLVEEPQVEHRTTEEPQ